jgi:hypothetical protein
MACNFTDLKTKTMTKEQIIEILDKYDSDFTLETGEIIQAIYFYDFGKLADELVKLFATPDVSNNEVAVCAFCGSENINKESDGMWCYDCNEWESTN